jgi:hypothetical protein
VRNALDKEIYICIISTSSFAQAAAMNPMQPLGHGGTSVTKLPGAEAASRETRAQEPRLALVSPFASANGKHVPDRDGRRPARGRSSSVHPGSSLAIQSPARLPHRQPTVAVCCGEVRRASGSPRRTLRRRRGRPSCTLVKHAVRIPNWPLSGNSPRENLRKISAFRAPRLISADFRGAKYRHVSHCPTA